jgi:molecular chaperone IbpA
MNSISIYDPFKFIDDLWSRTPSSRNESFPPFNIKQLDDETRVLELALAGFKKNEISIEVKHNTLTITGTKPEESESQSSQYLHRGIATRKFTKVVTLWEYWQVDSAHYENGILSIKMIRNIPEEAKPKSIAIKG